MPVTWKKESYTASAYTMFGMALAYLSVAAESAWGPYSAGEILRGAWWGAGLAAGFCAWDIWRASRCP